MLRRTCTTRIVCQAQRYFDTPVQVDDLDDVVWSVTSGSKAEAQPTVPMFLGEILGGSGQG